MIMMSDADFAAIEAALEFANTPYETDEEMAQLIALEATAVEAVRRVRRTADRPVEAPASEADRSS